MLGLSFRISFLVATSAFTGATMRAQTFEESFQSGTAALKGGQLDEAAEHFAECEKLQPEFAQTYLNLGIVRLQQGRPEDAAQQLRRGLELKPDLHGGRLFLGMAEYRLDHYRDAVATLQKQAIAEPANPVVLMWLGVAQLASGDTTDGVASLQKASKLKPGDVDILYHLGKAYMQASKESYERMYQAGPDSWRVHQVLAQSFDEADRPDDAIKECNRAIELQPREPGLHQQLGDIYWRQNHLEQAEAAFQEELKVDPQNLTSMYKLAAISVERSKPQVAVDLLSPVLKEHPESREAHYQRARAEVQLGETAEAIQDFQAVVKEKGEADADVLRQAFYNLSQLYRKTQQPEQAKLAMGSFLRLKEQSDAQRDQKLQDKLKRATEAERP